MGRGKIVDKTSMPKALAQLKAELVKKGQFTEEAVQKMSSAELKNSYSALNDRLKDMFPDLHPKYKTHTKETEKRAWVFAFMNDPVSGGSSCLTMFERRVEEVTNENEEWVHLNELIAPTRLNSPEDATIMISGGDIEERPSEYPSMRAAGKPQYLWNKVTKSLVKKKIISTSVSNENEMTGDQFKTVAAAMNDPNFAPSSASSFPFEVEPSPKQMKKEQILKVAAHRPRLPTQLPKKRKLHSRLSKARSRPRRRSTAGLIAILPRYS